MPLECWNTGIMGDKTIKYLLLFEKMRRNPNEKNPIIHYSIIPLFQCDESVHL
jgi:hypothetical protein